MVLTASHRCLSFQVVRRGGVDQRQGGEHLRLWLSCKGFNTEDEDEDHENHGESRDALRNNCFNCRRDGFPIVMAGEACPGAGRGPAIHVFS